MKFSISSVRIVDSDRDIFGTVSVENGKIASVQEEPVSTPPKKLLLPGMVDPHVHFRDPGAAGFQTAEDFASGSAAAAAGGVTTVFDMPNTQPPVFSAENLAQKRTIVSAKSLVRWGLFFGAGEHNLPEISAVKNVPGIKLYANDTTGHLRVSQEKTWRDIFSLGRRVVVHAEGETFVHLARVWAEIGFPCPLHLAHTARAIEVSALRDLKKKTDRISAEVAPHHLFFTAEDVTDGFLRMKPELGLKSDQEALWQGIADGTIDCAGSDHAPHPVSAKKTNTPAFGVPGVQHIFPLLFSAWLERGWDLQNLVRFTSQRAAEIFHLSPRGQIAPGVPADLALFDLTAPQKVSDQTLFSRCGWTPYGDFSLPCVSQTWVGGIEVFCDRKITAGDWRADEERFLPGLSQKSLD